MENELNATSSRPPIRVGIAGLGRAALSRHIPEFKKQPGLYKVTAACDLMKERRDLIEPDYPTSHMYRRVEDMLDDPEVDLIDLTLPSTDHLKYALASLKRNKWTLIEAPFALTYDDATVLKAASIKARGKLLVCTQRLFAADYRLALQALEHTDKLGDIYEIRLRLQDYIRRDDWQTVKRCGGGVSFYRGTDVLLQALGLLRTQPSQLWSELKRVAALGDAEDFAHIVLKTRGEITADIEINGGQLPPFEPAFTLRGTRGAFTVAPGASEGSFHVIDPEFKLPRRRSSVRTPSLDDMHEEIPVVDIPLKLDAQVETGDGAFWKAVYNTVRTAAPFPVLLDDLVETIRYLMLVKRASPFAK